MSDRLKGKRAFVTAAAVGIGRACAVAFAREGATVFATDIDEGKLAALKSEGIAEVAKLDARDSAAVAAMAKRAGKTDILLNAAGFVHHGTVLECSDEDWDFSFDLNVKSMHRTIRSFLPAMLENGGGSIVNISSISAHRPAPTIAAYAAAKAGLDSLTRSLAMEWGPRVRVNAIDVGLCRTEQTDDHYGDDARVAAIEGTIPLGRMATPLEVGNVAVFLASDLASYVSGARVACDGGGEPPVFLHIT